MAINEIHVNDIGTVFKLTVKDDTSVVDLSSNTGLTVILKKPSNAKLEKSAVLTNSGTDGLIEYTVAEGDIDESGTWQIQAKVQISDGTFYSDIHTFKVHRNL